MTTRSTTQRVATDLLAGSRASWATSANTTRSATSTSSRRPPDRRADAQPLPQPILRPCATQPAGGDDLDLTAPGGGRGLLQVTTGSSTPPAGPAPRSRPGRPRSCGSPWRPSSRSAGVLPSRIRRKLTRPGQPIAMRNSSTSAIGRTPGRRPSTSAPSSPSSPRSSSPRRQTCRVHARRGTQGDVECLQGWSTTGRWRPENSPAFLRQGTDRPNASPHATGTRESANTRRRRNRMFVRGLLTLEAEGLAIVRTPN
jgi:hypothetical protein